jgi:hypothetical protein
MLNLPSRSPAKGDSSSTIHSIATVSVTVADEDILQTRKGSCCHGTRAVAMLWGQNRVVNDAMVDGSEYVGQS